MGVLGRRARRIWFAIVCSNFRGHLGSGSGVPKSAHVLLCLADCEAQQLHSSMFKIVASLWRAMCSLHCQITKCMEKIGIVNEKKGFLR